MRTLLYEKLSVDRGTIVSAIIDGKIVTSAVNFIVGYGYNANLILDCGITVPFKSCVVLN